MKGPFGWIERLPIMMSGINARMRPNNPKAAYGTAQSARQCITYASIRGGQACSLRFGF